ncbi:nicotinate-nucleotide pyrophosphorylase [Neokomagataea thailandica NBRC 106555]|uniref:nicotinate-nucleotide diphosphorylase (carboxylating) n=2 Tax=Neokomagataea TaxID=1223423 RepID=A0ABQ0QR23_9PROT|nr:MULTISPECIES: carboxylating nicotinate-nucleotide diphosphorylase [Neokomagataea]QDH24689.1 carboxylating nicotinate-nucleotide diphosphorylase [Neokomagataea tanensis]GBR53823.1 nicotinate-nucleotide pyrophosphorylase [Neokomagataea thailandica NBRC 106555]
MTMTAFLPDLMWQPLIEQALREDLGSAGDMTSQVLGLERQTLTAIFKARHSGVVAGLAGARLAFTMLQQDARFEEHVTDGTRIQPGDVLATITATASTVLAGERTALNMLSHLSGVATATRNIVDLVAGTGVRVCCTRKTTPGLRSVEKYAVKAGGGSGHRQRLDDAVLIKDNHLAMCGGVRPALQAARARVGHLIKIELEVDTLDQLKEALSVGGADVYLLDNMSTDQLREAVALVGGRAMTEASGGITPETARSIAETGVDAISMGWLTHTVKSLDIGLDIEV